MSSKERVRRTFQYERTDRVTIGFETNPEIFKRLCLALGINNFDMEALYQALGVDYRVIRAPYIGKPLFTKAPENRRVDPLDGFITRWVAHESGGYWDFCDFPLKDAEDEVFDAYPVPSPDDFDYDAALDLAKSYGGAYGLHVGDPGAADVINTLGRIMSMEDILCHLQMGTESVLGLIERRTDYQIGMMERLIDKCKEHLDFVWIGEDLGTQIAPMINPALYRKYIKPVQKRFADLAAAYDLPIIVHTCGSSSWAYEDFIEIGIKGVDTLQPEAVNMSPEYLVEHFGGRLNFRGCISTTGPLAYGTPEQVEAHCQRTLEIMKPTRGYHFAPTHQIQDNTPVENVIAMYNSAYKYGQY